MLSRQNKFLQGGIVYESRARITRRSQTSSPAASWRRRGLPSPAAAKRRIPSPSPAARRTLRRWIPTATPQRLQTASPAAAPWRRMCFHSGHCLYRDRSGAGIPVDEGAGNHQLTERK